MGTVYIYIVLCVNVQYCIVPCIVQNRDSTLYEVKCAIKVLKAKYIQKSKMFFSSFYIYYVIYFRIKLADQSSMGGGGGGPQAQAWPSIDMYPRSGEFGKRIGCSL